MLSVFLRNAIEPCIVEERGGGHLRIFVLKKSEKGFDLICEYDDNGVVLASFKSHKSAMEALENIFGSVL